MIKTKKSLGQHFLHSPKIISDIVGAGDIHADDVVLEIGPGEGTLTESLLRFAGKVTAVEKDARLIPVLKEKFAEEIKNKKLQLIHADILECNIESLVIPDLDAVRGGQEKSEEAYSLYDDENFLKSNEEMRQIWKYKLVANIPYYITGQIIRMFLETKNQPGTMVLLVQKEVADRIIARDGKESLLSLSVKAFGTPKMVRAVGRGAFSPPPDVDSAVLLISNISREKLGDVSEKFFFKILHAGFSHKRKQLLPNLASLFPKEPVAKAFETCGIDPKARAEDLSLERWLKLCKILETERAPNLQK